MVSLVWMLQAVASVYVVELALVVVAFVFVVQPFAAVLVPPFAVVAFVSAVWVL
jgi:hypothetical protein